MPKKKNIVWDFIGPRKIRVPKFGRRPTGMAYPVYTPMSSKPFVSGDASVAGAMSSAPAAPAAGGMGSPGGMGESVRMPMNESISRSDSGDILVVKVF